MTAHAEKKIAETIDAANEFQEVPTPPASAVKPRLLIEDCNPDRTVTELRDILAAAGGLYDRGVPVRLAFDQMQRGMVAQVMTADALVLMAHAACRALVEAGYDPASALEAYRGDKLSICVRSIGEGARLTVEDDRHGKPRLRQRKGARGCGAGSSVRQIIGPPLVGSHPQSIR